MKSSKPLHYRLTPRAIADIEEIWRYTAQTWSITQADQYTDSLAHIPTPSCPLAATPSQP